jgi:hypothetical protein
MCFDHQANYRTELDIEHIVLDQKFVDRSIEPTVIHNVIDMPVDVIVHPPCRDIAEVPVITSLLGMHFHSTLLTFNT